jgi:hypothetical protein
MASTEDRPLKRHDPDLFHPLLVFTLYSPDISATSSGH